MQDLHLVRLPDLSAEDQRDGNGLLLALALFSR